MVDRPTINDVLRMHLFQGGGVAHNLRMLGEPYDYLNAVSEFFSAASDHERLVASHRLSTIVLRLNNMEYMIQPRDIVRRLEIERLLGYEKQQDHTIHSIYLYILGIWIFDNSNLFKSQYMAHYGHNKSSNFEEFQFDWLLSGLLHDIGYIVENLTDDTEFGRRCLDDLFSSTIEGLSGHFPHIEDSETLKKLQNQVSTDISRWTSKKRLPRYEPRRSASTVLKELRKAPWIPELLGHGKSRTNVIFSKFLFKACGLLTAKTEEISKQLHAYANYVSEYGYSPNRIRTHQLVDHAYASGCIQLQLVTFRYWLISRAPEDIRDDLTRGYDYSIDNLPGIVRATFATALHNVLPINPKISKLTPFSISDSPLLFLSILVDELQKWHRFPSGRRLTKQISSYEYVNEKELFLEVQSESGENVLYFSFDSNERYKKMRDAIYSRLNDSDLRSFFRFDVQDVNQIDEVFKQINRDQASRKSSTGT